jgi:hypothetical protein
VWYGRQGADVVALASQGYGHRHTRHPRLARANFSARLAVHPWMGRTLSVGESCSRLLRADGADGVCSHEIERVTKLGITKGSWLIEVTLSASVCKPMVVCQA